MKTWVTAVGRRLPRSFHENQWPWAAVCTSSGFSAGLLSFCVPYPKILRVWCLEGTLVPFGALAVAADRSFGSLVVVYATYSFILCSSGKELRG